MAIVNNQVLEQIRRDGAKKIDINFGQYLETARDSIEHTRDNIFQRLGREVLPTLLEREEDRRKLAEADNINARLSISLDTRRSGLEPADLTPLVERLNADSEDEDDFVVETKSGERIKKGRLLLAKTVNIEAFEKTVHHNVAWELMSDYYHELDERGALGQ